MLTMEKMIIAVFMIMMGDLNLLSSSSICC